MSNFTRYLRHSPSLDPRPSDDIWVLKSEAEADKQAALAKAAMVVSPEVQTLRNELNEARHQLYIRASQIEHWCQKSQLQEKDLQRITAELAKAKKKKPTKKKAHK